MADGEHIATPSSKKPLLIVGVLVVVALVVVVFFSLAGGDAGPLGGIVNDDTPPTPEFAFVVAEPKTVETASAPNHQAAVTASQTPARAVTQRLDDLYTAAFLDPGNWMEGSYVDVVGFFSDDASSSAEDQLDVLTAGPGAAEAFDSIRPLPGRLKLRVLLDPAGVARSVEGSARFVARGTGPAGQVTMISTGQFIFGRVDGEWVVVSFSVQRSDEERTPKPGASTSPGASAEPSEAEPT